MSVGYFLILLVAVALLVGLNTFIIYDNELDEIRLRNIVLVGIATGATLEVLTIALVLTGHLALVCYVLLGLTVVSMFGLFLGLYEFLFPDKLPEPIANISNDWTYYPPEEQ